MPHFTSTKLSLCTCLLLVVFCAGGQVKQKMEFSSVNQIGLLTGNNAEALTVQTINGVKKERWFVGIGVGLDFYKNKTVPLFLDIRRDFSKKINTPFVYADAGVNFLTLNSSQKNVGGVPTSPGVFYDAGIGWKLTSKQDRSFIFSAGYTLKQVRQKFKVLYGAPTIQLQEESYDYYKYFYRRFVLKLWR